MNRTRWFMLAVLVLGLAERVLWNGLRATTGAEAEAFNVAAAIAEGRGFADAYRTGAGPTAHLTPVTPVLAGGVYAALGVKSFLSEAVLAIWSIGLALGTHLLLYRAFGRIGVPRPLRLFAFAWGCLAPTYINQEAVDFRVWEGGLATFAVALFLDRLLRLVEIDERSPRPAIAVAAIGGAIFFINPAMGVGVIACMALFAFRHLSVGATLAAAGSGAAMIAVLVTPWAIRNADALGAFVPLRSNAGLELALSNYPGAEDVSDEHQAYLSRIARIHPSISDEAYRRLRKVGELEYSNSLGREAVDWMRGHPGTAIKKAAGNFREMFVPSDWKFDPSGISRIAWLRTPLAQATGVFGLIGMLVAMSRFGMAALYPAIYVLTVAVMISPFQPVVRYIYVISPVLVSFAACTGLLLARATPSSPPRRPRVKRA
ncbi:hypothetical protein [uncultured Sphingomonas sp.]|uniref:hypothetical protein n=1 Tax=uncultured Sphingomonas sp. TaxID=158754 RepID=UPI0035CB80DB